MKRFHSASYEEIKSGETTDIYFQRTKQILEATGQANKPVIVEVTSGKLPNNWPWGVLCGVEEVARLFEDVPIDIYTMPEGSVFSSHDWKGIREPVMRLEGPYGEFCIYETSLLGLICQSSGVATRSARIKKIVGDKKLFSFGIRRMHPTLSPMIDRSAYIGGFDGVSGLSGAKLLGIEPTGTMPHALIIVMGDQVNAWKAFDEVVSPRIPRVALVDTYSDEKMEAIMAVEALKDRLFAVRLDTPASRKGDFGELIREIRWELDVRGFDYVKIFVSGGLREEVIKNLDKAGADAFGVGTSVSNAPTINFAMDIVEVDGKLCAKRGKMSGKKQVWRCQNCFVDLVFPFNRPPPRCPQCKGQMQPMLKLLINRGSIVGDLPKPQQIRQYVLAQIERLNLKDPLLDA